MVQEYARDLDRYENHQRDGNEFEEFEEFSKNKRLDRIKKLRYMLKNKKKDVFEPHPFYSSLYGTPADLTGLYTSPLEYYDGTIIDGPDNLVNPYETIEISFKLPPIPSSDAEIPIEVSTDDEIKVEDKNKDENDLAEGDLEVKDMSDYHSYKPADLSQWAQYMFSKIPRHSGRETVGIERCISYLKKFDGDLSRAISSDYQGEADIAKLEEARKELNIAIYRLNYTLPKLTSDTP